MGIPSTIEQDEDLFRDSPVIEIAGSIRAGSYAYTSPYGGCWLQHYYAKHWDDLFQGKVRTTSDFVEKLLVYKDLPELMIMGNFVAERFAIVTLCRALGVNVVHSEDGFFPHYETMHADPLGFCWESSLTRMLFRTCTVHQRRRAQAARSRWLTFPEAELPGCIHPPYVLWPLQLLSDCVNRWDLNVDLWGPLIEHFRACLPVEFQLVVKKHPRGKERDNSGIEETVRSLPNTALAPCNADLRTLLHRSAGVAGANSTVLCEARLMFHKPTYVYARGWFTNHHDLFFPVARNLPPRPLSFEHYLDDNRLMRCQWLDDYTDWFLYQLLVRQITRQMAEQDPVGFQAEVGRLSFHSYRDHGDRIFL